MEETFINLPVLCTSASGPYDFNKSLTRSKFNQLTANLIKKTEGLLTELLKETNTSIESIDEIIMVGGSTRIPAVRDMVTKFFKGKELNHSINPDQVVAYGAAIKASSQVGETITGAASKPILVDTVALSYGIEDAYGVLIKLINRNSTIPVTKKQTFTNFTDNQPLASIRVFQGERTMAADNTLVGTFDVELVPKKKGQNQIEVSFSIDYNGMLEVSAIDLSLNKKANITIEKQTLTQEQIDEAIQRAEQYAAEDKKKEELSKKINFYEQSLFELEQALSNSEYSGKETEINSLINELNLLKEKTIDDSTLEKFLQDVNVVMSKFFAMPKNSQAAPSEEVTTEDIKPEDTPEN